MNVKMKAIKATANFRGMRNVFTQGMTDLGEDRLPLFGRGIVKDWDGQPVFVSNTKRKNGNIHTHCKPVGQYAEKWMWVNDGTKPHRIEAKGAGGLYFRTGYQPKTKPNTPSFVGPGISTGDTVGPVKAVNHPGSEPRNFEVNWIKWAREWWPDEAYKLIKAGLRGAR